MIGRQILHYVRVIIGVDFPETQTTEMERQMLSKFLQGRKCIIEIGVFEGFTTRWLSFKADPDAIVYGIDPFFKGRLGISWGEKIAIRYNRKALKEKKVIFIERFSPDLADDLPRTVDYIFIDADHSLAGIMRDWIFWSDILTPGGIIALHDTLIAPNSPNELGSHRYFRSNIQHDSRFKIVGQQDSLSVLKKL